MIASRNVEVAAVAVKAVEGKPMYGGDMLVKPLMKGDEMTFLEIHYAAGVGAPLHAHTHESIAYVVKGKVKSTVGSEVFIMGPGDVCRQKLSGRLCAGWLRSVLFGRVFPADTGPADMLVLVPSRRGHTRFTSACILVCSLSNHARSDSAAAGSQAVSGSRWACATASCRRPSPRFRR